MTIKNFSPYSIVRTAIEGLKDNEKTVITGRFGIDGQRKTLSAIGKELHLSRERIRQVEKESLRKLALKVLEQHNSVIEQMIALFEKNGGIVANSKAAEKFLEKIHQEDKNQFNSLNLIFCLLPQLKKIEKTRELEEGWILASVAKDDAVRVINDWVSHLKKTKKPETLEVLLEANPEHKKYKVAFLSELPTISKRIIKTETGHIGLSSWSEINPRNIRDKIYYVLKKIGRPTHFADVASAINKQKFDNKKVVKATVHNELIADDRFVLVGRGIYALKEWGYDNGTVFDIIREILLEKTAGLSVDEIVSAVLKQRLVKRNTILINLKTRPEFKRVGEEKYALK